jgi:hypothetical protein
MNLILLYLLLLKATATSFSGLTSLPVCGMISWTNATSSPIVNSMQRWPRAALCRGRTDFIS